MSTEEKKGLKQQQLVSFRLGVEEYGVSIMKVQEIIRMQEITKVPQMPEFIEGIINLRGNVIPIIDLRKRFGLSCAEKTIDSRIVVVSVRERIVG
nr:chemotaxis protein CheW [Candidatus Wallbacteria bacterium]